MSLDAGCGVQRFLGAWHVYVLQQGVTRGYKDGLQPESLAGGNWLVKQNHPVSKILK